MTVAIWLGITIAGALGAVAAATLGAPPAFFAGGIALSFAGLAGAATAAASALHASDDLTEPREPRGPSNVDASDVVPGTQARPVFGRLWFIAAGAFALLGLVPLIALARRPLRNAPTGWRSGIRLVDEDNVPVRAGRLAAGGVETVFPQNALSDPQAPAMLIRLDSANYVAYSKVCTHAGCPVALYRHESQQLICPCHQSVFDVRDGAKNLSGPATRPLPKLPIAVDSEGYLIARGDFDGPVGPDDWDRVL